MKQTLSKIIRPSLRAGQNVLSGFPHAGAPASFVERVRPQQSSRTFHTTPALSATDRSGDQYVCGIRVSSKTTEHWEDALSYKEENTFSSARQILESVNTSNEIIPPFEDFNFGLAGKLVALAEGKKEKTIYPLSSVEEVRNIDAIVFLGLDTADNEKGIISGIQGFGKLLGNGERASTAENKNIVAFYPKEQRDRRYKDGLLYFINENFTPKWAEVFVAQYIFLRLVDENGQLLHPEKIKPLVMLGYDLGAQEAIMVENAMIDLLQNMFGKADKEIAPYMNKILRFGIGHAVNWEYPVRSITSYAISITAVKDIGIRRPQSFMNGAFAKGEFIRQPLTLKHHATIHDSPPREFLAILKETAPFVEKAGEKRLNKLGHGLPHYLVAIESQGKQVITILKDFMEGRDGYLMQELAKKSSEFEPNQKMSEEVHIELMTSWSNHLYNQALFEAQRNTRRSRDICNNSSQWREYFSLSNQPIDSKNFSSTEKSRNTGENQNNQR